MVRLVKRSGAEATPRPHRLFPSVCAHLSEQHCKATTKNADGKTGCRYFCKNICICQFIRSLQGLLRRRASSVAFRCMQLWPVCSRVMRKPVFVCLCHLSAECGAMMLRCSLVVGKRVVVTGVLAWAKPRCQGGEPDFEWAVVAPGRGGLASVRRRLAVCRPFHGVPLRLHGVFRPFQGVFPYDSRDVFAEKCGRNAPVLPSRPGQKAFNGAAVVAASGGMGSGEAHVRSVSERSACRNFSENVCCNSARMVKRHKVE